jgi:hypothetical protein
MKSTIIAGLLALTGAAHAGVLYDNGAPVDAQGLSILNPPQEIYGQSVLSSAGNAVADTFKVAAGGWSVSGMEFFAYQSGAGNANFTFGDVTWSIRAGGGENTALNNPANILATGTSSASDAGFVGYRVAASTPSDTSRAIYGIQIAIPAVNLTAGEYWLTWSIAGSSAYTGPWQPPTADNRVGDAEYSTNGMPFNPLVDYNFIGAHNLALPFVIDGTIAAVPEPGTAALALVGGLALLGLARRRGVL